MKRFLLCLFVAGALTGCSKFLNKPPFASLTPDNSFKNVNDLILYTNSFYNNAIPAASVIYGGDNTSDYIAGNNIPGLMTPQNNPDQAVSWNWAVLRNINYFLENNTEPSIPLPTRNNYAGLARFFRAWFYFGMVRSYGDVPWYGNALATDDSALYKPRDPRTLVMDSVVADLDFAIANLTATKDNTASVVTKWTALALKSRVCLFEGTYRKYHTELNLTGSAADFLNKALDASQQLISSGQYKLHNTGNPASDYRALFITEAPFSDEVILASVYSTTLKKYHESNQYFTSVTLGNRSSPTKSFIDTYLKLDGTRFTDQASFDTVFFTNEMKNRDLRLQQTVRCNGYKRSDGTSAPPDYSYTFTGYQLLKYLVDDKTLDSKALNTNSLPIFRYAEVLLTLAEAKAELGTFTPTDWANTIALLRKRAGITNTDYPTTVDPYLQQKYYSNITDPALMEIRRERGVELMMEGLRFDDLRRWKAGTLMNLPYNGVYVPQMNVPYAMNGDGKLNVAFVTKAPTSGAVPGVYYYTINGTLSQLTQTDHGNIIWLANTPRAWNDKMYLNPISTADRVLNPNLGQNPGW